MSTLDNDYFNKFYNQVSIDGNLYYELKPEYKEIVYRCNYKQLEEWINGNSLHTDNLPFGYELPEGFKNQCCPDFSCCDKNLEWQKEDKERFLMLYKENREQEMSEMLFSSFKNFKETFKENKIHLANTPLLN